MLWRLILLWCLLVPSLARAETYKAQLFLSWNLRPYWEFTEGFKKTKLFKTKVNLLPEEKNIWGKAQVLVPVGHRAFSWLSERPPKPLFAALVLHPSLILEGNSTASKFILGGLYLRLPPEVVFPLLCRELAPFFEGHPIIFGIPYSSPFNLSFIKEAQALALLWGFKVEPLPLKEGMAVYEKALQRVDVIYFLPDPFLESEEVISHLIKMAVLAGKIVVGYNHFYLEKGALLALLINYQRAGVKAAQLLYQCLKVQKCGWDYAPFEVAWNEKARRFYQRKEKVTPPQKPVSRLSAVRK